MAEKPYDLKERTFQFSMRAQDITEKLPKTVEATVARHQLSRSAPSVAANVHEADVALTRPEKRQAFGRSLREANESFFWLMKILDKWPITGIQRDDVQEAYELVLILRSIVNEFGDDPIQI